MAVSWIERTKLFKSPVRVVAGFLLRSRETQAKSKRHFQEESRKRNTQLKRQADLIEDQRRDIARLKRQVEVLQCELAEAKKAPPALPVDPPLPGHSYGARQVGLAVTLAQRLVDLITFRWSVLGFPPFPRLAACAAGAGGGRAVEF